MVPRCIQLVDHGRVLPHCDRRVGRLDRDPRWREPVPWCTPRADRDAWTRLPVGIRLTEDPGFVRQLKGIWNELYRWWRAGQRQQQMNYDRAPLSYQLLCWGHLHPALESRMGYGYPVPLWRA